MRYLNQGLVRFKHGEVCAFEDCFMVPRLLQVASNYYVDTRILDTWVPRYKVVIDAFNNFRTDIAFLKFLVDTHCAF
jgi:hypothetical protein